MKLSTVAFILAGVLAFVAIVVSAPAANDTQLASMVATKSAIVAAGLAAALGMSVSAGVIVARMVAVPHRHEGRGAPLAPPDLYHHRGDSAIQVSVDDLYDRSRRGRREGTLS